MYVQRDYRGERENYEELQRAYDALESGVAELHDELNELREIQALTVERAERAEKCLRHMSVELEEVYEDLGDADRRAERAEERASSWWEAAKVYCRALDFAWKDIAEYESHAAEAEARAEKAEEANLYLARDLRHSREDYESLNDAYDALWSDFESQARMNQKNAQELIELKAALRTLGGDRD